MTTVAVTGGSGWIGRVVLRELNDAGYQTANLSRERPDEVVADEFVTTDVLDAGEVFATLHRCGAEAIVHLATIPTPTGDPPQNVYRSNVLGSYNVLLAAGQLGVSSVCLASSINVMGYNFQDAPVEVEYLPIDESHPLTPRGPYSYAKHALEVTADGVTREFPGLSISSLRLPGVFTAEQLASFCPQRGTESIAINQDRDGSSNELFTYIHRSDAARLVRCAIETPAPGHERYWAVADDTTSDRPTATLTEEYFPEIEVKEPFEGYEGLVSNAKVTAELDWEPAYSWR